jgi:hypothetical protein
MNITTQQIPREQWQSFFDDLGKNYRGWAATVEVMGQDLGDQLAEEGLAFQGISFEQAGTDAGNIRIEIGDTPSSFLTNHIDQPSTVSANQSQPGAEVDMEIEAEDGTATLLRLRPRDELGGA